MDSKVSFNKQEDWESYLKQFKEYRQFEYLYHPEYIKLWKMSKGNLSGNDTKIINLIIGDAAKALGLSWDIINDGKYLIGFYETGTSTKDMILKIPYEINFKSLHGKMIEWFKKKSMNKFKEEKPKIILSENHIIKSKIPQSKTEIYIRRTISHFLIKYATSIITMSQLDPKTGENKKRIYINFDKVLIMITPILSSYFNIFSRRILGRLKFEKGEHDSICITDNMITYYQETMKDKKIVNSIIAGYKKTLSIGSDIMSRGIMAIIKNHVNDEKSNECLNAIIASLRHPDKRELPMS